MFNMCLIFLSQKFIMQLLDSALFGSFLFFTLRSIRRSRKQSADQRQTENKKKRIKIWMTGMIFMIHRKPGFLNVKFVDKDFLCLKFSIANGIFRVILSFKCVFVLFAKSVKITQQMFNKIINNIRRDPRRAESYINIVR